jgi:hypothetical protein
MVVLGTLLLGTTMVGVIEPGEGLAGRVAVGVVVAGRVAGTLVGRIVGIDTGAELGSVEAGLVATGRLSKGWVWTWPGRSPGAVGEAASVAGVVTTARLGLRVASLAGSAGRVPGWRAGVDALPGCGADREVGTVVEMAGCVGVLPGNALPALGTRPVSWAVTPAVRGVKVGRKTVRVFSVGLSRSPRTPLPIGVVEESRRVTVVIGRWVAAVTRSGGKPWFETLWMSPEMWVTGVDCSYTRVRCSGAMA